MAANPISFYLFLFCNIFEQGQGNAHSDVYFFSRDSYSDEKITDRSRSEKTNRKRELFAGPVVDWFCEVVVRISRHV